MKQPDEAAFDQVANSIGALGTLTKLYELLMSLEGTLNIDCCLRQPQAHLNYLTNESSYPNRWLVWWFLEGAGVQLSSSNPIPSNRDKYPRIGMNQSSS